MLPTTAASTVDGVIAFMKAAFGLRFAADFLAAGFFAALFLAAGFLAALFFAAGFFAAPFFAAGFLAAVFFAAFLAVALFLLPVSGAGRITLQRLRRDSLTLRHDAPSAATIPHFHYEEGVARAIFHSGERGVATARTKRDARRAFVGFPGVRSNGGAGAR
jgi:hypothetical protein